jgi:hypothetical protein
MPLSAGSRLGAYEVGDPLGAGGMSACGRSARATRDAQATRGWDVDRDERLFTLDRFALVGATPGGR